MICCNLKDVEDKHNIKKFIGVKDSRGKPIHEGDIVRTRHGNGIVYQRENGCFAIRNDYYIIAKDGICPFDISVHNLLQNNEVLEVIGNIHENHELLH